MAVFVVAVGLYVVLAAATDARMHRVPNYLTVPAALMGLAYHGLAPTGWGVLVSLAGFGVGFALLFVPWLLGGSGMGDVKLLAALGAWLGPECVLAAFAVSTVLAAVAALAIMIHGGTTRGVFKTMNRFAAARRSTDKSTKKRPARAMPFAVPVAVSTWTVLAWMIANGGLF